MKRPLITWFRNDHEHSLHYFKYGLMRLAKKGEIRFQEIGDEEDGGLLPDAVRAHKHRRTAVVRIDEGGRSRLLILDGEDSLFQTSPLIEHCDYYFSCTYRRKFFEGESFDLELPWQTECELAPYREKYELLQKRFHEHLHKARPFMPIGPAMEMPETPSLLQRRIGGLRHRLSQLRLPQLDWGPQFGRFERRWDRMMQLRELEPRHDVALKDSLWGWPRHRVALHHELQRLSSRFDIYSELHYREVLDFECGAHPKPLPKKFPMVAGGGVQGNYEEMLAMSRLGVFSTGFHYGCRNILTLAWLLGMKTLSDPFSYEAIYGFKDLDPFIHRSGDWSELGNALEMAATENLESRRRRQKAFDAVALPEHGARHIVETSLAR